MAREPDSLSCFDLAEADESGELVALIDDGFGVGCSGFQGAGEDVGGDVFEIGSGLSRHPLQDIVSRVLEAEGSLICHPIVRRIGVPFVIEVHKMEQPKQYTARSRSGCRLPRP